METAFLSVTINYYSFKMTLFGNYCQICHSNARYAHENNTYGIKKRDGDLQVRSWFHALMQHINDFNALIGKAIVNGMRANKGAVITRFHVGALSA